MPFYDYKCPHCDNEEEIQHLMKEDPQIKCSSCGYKKMEKQIALVSVNTKTGVTNRARSINTHVKKSKEMKQELRDDFGIHDVSITQQGMSYKKIYDEIKGNGKEVKDTMIEKRKQNGYDLRKKNIEKQKKFATIRDQRIKEIKERSAKTAYENRSINPIKGKTID